MFSFKFDTNTTLFIWRCVIYPILKVKSSDSIHAISLHYRGISLQCAAAKIYSSVLKNRFEGISHALNTSTFVTFIDLQKDWFRCNVGVWQEDSYTQHYSLYFKKDLVLKLKTINKGYQIDSYNLSMLLYADDIAFGGICGILYI